MSKSRQRRISGIIPKLLSWFSENARDLPWRRTRDPYAIWVSEIMLQQTQVKTVLPYWDRWMQALPNIESLAQADSHALHKLWEGLGYYTRVRNMHAAAQQIVERHGGKFPEEFEAILDLPGIGRYTAGAIASIAFNQPQPILDGNVMRVLTRVFGIRENAREKSVNERLWGIAQELVEEAGKIQDFCRSRRKEALVLRAVDADSIQSQHKFANKTGRDEFHLVPDIPNQFGTRWNSSLPISSCSALNQSLMELGALVCTPRNPLCGECPLRLQCIARREGLITSIPNLGKKVETTRRTFAAFVVEHRGRVLVRQRPAGVVNAHLWEFPNVEIAEDNFDSAKAARKAVGFVPKNLAALGTVKHTITRYRIKVQAFHGQFAGKKLPKGEGKWLGLDELDALPFTAAHRRILKLWAIAGRR